MCISLKILSIQSLFIMDSILAIKRKSVPTMLLKDEITDSASDVKYATALYQWLFRN